ncbi:Rid family hydrolase, partial [Staphylococcus epidermidis]|uniref:Rid family hydrolase n=1 Tax=Staphylococcus epidermidis TaxID=1282 RepID=UPI0037DA530D
MNFIIKIINSHNLPQPLPPYSHPTLINPFLFTSPQIPLTLHPTILTHHLQQQTNQLLQNLTVLLKQPRSHFNSLL